MANFCTNCGSKLNENKICLCQTQPTQELEKENYSQFNNNQEVIASDKQSIQVEVDIEKIKDYVSRLFGCLLSGIKQPITTFEYLIKNQSYDLGIGLFVLSSLVTMAVVTILDRCFVGGLAADVLSYIVPSTIGMKLLFSIALYLNILPTILFGGFILIFQLLILKKANFKEIFTICGGSHLVIIIAQIASLVGVLFPQLIIPVIVIGNIAGLILVYSGIKQCYPLTKDMILWIITGSSLGSSLVYLYFMSTMITEKFSSYFYELESMLNYLF